MRGFPTGVKLSWEVFVMRLSAAFVSVVLVLAPMTLHAASLEEAVETCSRKNGSIKTCCSLLLDDPDEVQQCVTSATPQRQGSSSAAAPPKEPQSARPPQAPPGAEPPAAKRGQSGSSTDNAKSQSERPPSPSRIKGQGGTTENAGLSPTKTPGKWRPFSFDPGSPYAAKCATKQEFAVMESHLKKIRAIWEQIPAIANPIGYEVRANRSGFTDYCVYVAPTGKGRETKHFYNSAKPIVGDLHFFPFPYSEYKGKIIPAHETSAIYFRINSIPKPESLPHLDGVYLEPVRLADRFGVPAYGMGASSPSIYSESVLIIRNNDRMLWKPASLLGIYEQYLDKAVLDIEGFENDAKKKKKEYEEYITPKARALRKEKHKQFAPAMSRSMKKTEAEIIAWQEDLARKSEEHYRKNAEEAIPRPGTDWARRREDIRKIGEMRDQLKANNPKANAYLCKDINQSVRELAKHAELYRPEPGPGCRAVVTTNHKYFDPKLPKTAMQLITVSDYYRCVDTRPDEPPGGCTEDMKLLKGIDWNKVRALMDK